MYYLVYLYVCPKEFKMTELKDIFKIEWCEYFIPQRETERLKLLKIEI
jgi:hypothetical protein